MTFRAMFFPEPAAPSGNAASEDAADGGPWPAIGWRDHALGAALAGLYVAWLLATARSLGFPRDEGFYFRAARDYARWFELLASKPHLAMQQAAIDGPWSDNHEHPSLMKSLFA